MRSSHEQKKLVGKFGSCSGICFAFTICDSFLCFGFSHRSFRPLHHILHLHRMFDLAHQIQQKIVGRHRFNTQRITFQFRIFWSFSCSRPLKKSYFFWFGNFTQCLSGLLALAALTALFAIFSILLIASLFV